MERKKAGDNQPADKTTSGTGGKENPPGTQADHNSIAIGGISISGDVTGTITIGHGYTAEQVSQLLTQIGTKYQRKPFDGRCPYKGLDVFEEEDAELFFGRERLVEDLISRVQESRTVFITGPSGSGKSSLVRAGLIHALKQGAVKGGQDWLYETMKPGREPIKDLALAFSRVKGPDLADYVQAHANELDVLHKCAESVLSGNKDQRFVLFVDQFEEVFTQVSQETERQAFLNMLAHAATLENGRVIVLFAMRSDFLSNCAPYPQLNALINQSRLFQVGAMQPEELVSAIALPARQVGLPIEDELIARIINDMKGEPGALPLMQFALKDLFDSQQEKGGVIALTLEDYLRHGGIHKSLERHADRSFAKLSESEQQLARSIFGGLIEIGRGTVDTRRTALFDELIPTNTKAEDVLTVVQKLADARLIITDEQAGKDTVTISHEKLIDAWPWLKKLVNENREAIALQNDIANDAKEWDDHQRDASYLYIGARLANAREQLEGKKLRLGGLAQNFIDSSIEAVETERWQEDRRRLKELEDARKLAVAEAMRAEEQARSAAKLRRGTVYLRVALAVALVLGITAVFFAFRARGQEEVALQQRDEAQRQSKIAFSRQLDAEAIAHLNDRFDLAGLLALETVRLSDKLGETFEGRNSLLRTLQANPRLTTIFYVPGDSDNLAFSPDGKTFASDGGEQGVRLWDIASHRLVRILDFPYADLDIQYRMDQRSSIAFSPDGKTILWGNRRGNIHWRDIETYDSEEMFPFTGHTGAVNSIAFSSDGLILASGSNDTTIRLWNWTSREQLRPNVFQPNLGGLLGSEPEKEPSSIVLRGHTAAVNHIVFSPDGKILASGSDDNTIILWDVATHQQLGTPLTGHTGPVNSVAFSPDGKILASGSDDNTIILWDMATHQQLGVPLIGHTGPVNSVAFGPDGKTLASGSDDKRVILWDMATHQRLGEPLMGHTRRVYRVIFGRDGKTLISGSADHKIIIWDVRADQRLGKSILHNPAAMNSVAFSPAGKILASGSDDNTIILWDVAAHQKLGAPLTGHTGPVNSVAFSPNGKILASGSDDESVILWDVATHQPLGTPLTGRTGEVTGVAFSPDGKILASASTGSTIVLWDVATHQPLGEPLSIPIIGVPGQVSFFGSITSLAFSPDGKTLASGGVDIVLWDVATHRQIDRPFTGQADQVLSVAFSPDGKTLASASADNSILLWDVATRQPIGTLLTGHTDRVLSVAFSPDGQTLASASADNSILLWDVATHQRLGEPLSVHTGKVLSLAFSPGGNLLVSGSADKSIIQWDVSLVSWKARVCNIVARNLTPAEWTLYLDELGESYRKTCEAWPLYQEPESTATPK